MNEISTSLRNPDVHPERVVITRQFDDVDAYAEAIKPLNVTAYQLTPGPFLGCINSVNLGGLRFTYVTYNQACRATGPKPSDELAFTMLHTNQTEVLSHGCLVKEQDIFGFDLTRETDLITGKDAQIVFASVQVGVFQSLAQQMGYDLGQRFLKQNLIGFDPSSLRPLKAYYQQITQVLISQPKLLIQSQIQSLLIEDFLPLLINVLGTSARQGKHEQTFRRYKLVKKAEEIANSYIDQPLTLQQLCNEIGTSSSALCYGFQDIFGLSPMAYIKIQRLNGVRRTLRNADPNTTTVMEVAYQWGFWSAGHFSRDYKELFGELPSQTLRNHAIL